MQKGSCSASYDAVVEATLTKQKTYSMKRYYLIGVLTLVDMIFESYF